VLSLLCRKISPTYNLTKYRVKCVMVIEIKNDYLLKINPYKYLILHNTQTTHCLAISHIHFFFNVLYFFFLYLSKIYTKIHINIYNRKVVVLYFCTVIIFLYCNYYFCTFLYLILIYISYFSNSIVR
jgi:hypothetical protein